MGLSLLSPWFLLGAAAVALPIVLHLLARHTAPEVTFSAARFVPEAPVEQQRRRRLTDWLLLALRVSALLLLALAFARPFGDDAAASADARVRVVAVDTSFSMAAPGAWDAAVDAAREQIAGAPSGWLVAVVAFEESPRTVSPPTFDRGAAAAAVARLRPGLGATDYRAATSGASEVLARRGGEVVLITDRQRSALRAQLPVPQGVTLAVRDVPPARVNLAVGDLVRDGSAIVAAVANHGLEAASTFATLAIDDQPAARQAVDVPAGTTVRVRFEGASRPRGIASVRVTDEGGVPADDVRHLVLDEPAPTIVWSVGDEASGFYVERALANVRRSPRIEVRRVAPGDVEPDAAAGNRARPAVIVLHATRGLDAGWREALGRFVGEGAGLLIAAGPDVEAGALAQILGGRGGFQVGQADAAPVPAALAPLAVRHAVFAAHADRASAFASVRFDRLVRLQPADGDRVLARFDNDLPALIERQVGAGRVLVLASDLDARWNQWPLSHTFVPFVFEAVTYLAAREEPPSAFLVGDAPADIAQAPGAHVLADGRRVVVNVDPRESDIDLATAEEIQAAAIADPTPRDAGARRAAALEADQSWWWYVVLAMLLVVLTESAVGSRRAAAA